MKHWINRGRNYDKLPKIKSLAMFVTTWKKWWLRLQPPCRRPDGGAWPPLRTMPASADDWSAVKRGGCNGLFMVIMALSWWVHHAAEDPALLLEARNAAEDVHWVCTAMLGDSLIPTADPVARSPLMPVEAAPVGATPTPMTAAAVPTTSRVPAPPRLLRSPFPHLPSPRLRRCLKQ